MAAQQGQSTDGIVKGRRKSNLGMCGRSIPNVEVVVMRKESVCVAARGAPVSPSVCLW